MTDCANVTMREQLPELAAGTLSAAACAGVEMHVAGCAECSAELAVIRSVRSGVRLATPPIDVAGIAAALPRAAARTSRWSVGSWQAAAAIMLLAVGAGTVAVINRSVETGAAVDTVVASAILPADEGLALTGRIEGMNDRQIRALIRELDDIDALPSVEVERISPAMDLTAPRDLVDPMGEGETD